MKTTCFRLFLCNSSALVSSFLLLPHFPAYLLRFVVGAKISDLSGAVLIPAAKLQPAAAVSTPPPSFFDKLMSGSKRLSAKAKGKQQEKAKAAALPVGYQSLKKWNNAAYCALCGFLVEMDSSKLEVCPEVWGRKIVN